MTKLSKYYDKKKDKIVTKYVGGSFKDSKKEVGMKEMMQSVCPLLFDDDLDGVVKVYKKYCQEANQDSIDITRWCKKVNTSEKELAAATNPKAGTTQKKQWEAIKDLEPQQGDRHYLYDSQDGMIQQIVKGEPQFFKKTGEPKMKPNYILKRMDKYNDDHVKSKLLRRCYDVISIFDSVLDMSNFLDYSKAKNAKLLEEK